MMGAIVATVLAAARPGGRLAELAGADGAVVLAAVFALAFVEDVGASAVGGGFNPTPGAGADCEVVGVAAGKPFGAGGASAEAHP